MLGAISRRGVMEMIAYLGAVGPLEGRSSQATDDGLPGMSWPMFKQGPRNQGEYSGSDFLLPLTTGWRASPAGTPTAPVVEGKQVYTGTSEGAAYAFDFLEGGRQWSADLDGPVRTPLAVGDGTVVAGTDGGTVHGLSPADGSEQWRYDAGAPVTGGMTVEDGTSFFGTEDGTLHAVDIGSGTVEWTAGTGNGAVNSVPAVDDGTVFVTTSKNRVYAIENGSRRWGKWYQESLLGAPVAFGDRVAVGTEFGVLHGLQTSNGRQRWEESLRGVHVGGPTILNNLLYTPTDRGYIHVLDQGGGEFARLRTDLSIGAPLLPTNQGVIVLSTDGRVYLVELSTGAVDELVDTDPPTQGVSTVAAGQNGLFFAVSGALRSVVNPDSQAVRRQFEQLDSMAEAAREDGVDVGQVSNYRQKAITLFRDGNYEAALEAVKEGKEYVQQRRKQFARAREARKSLRSALEDARADGLVVESVETNYLDEVEELIANGEYEAAIQRANEGLDRIAAIRESAAAASEAIDALSAAIDDCESSLPSVKIPDAKAALETVKELYGEGRYDEARSRADAAREQLEQRCKRAKTARQRLDALIADVDSAEAAGLVVDETKAMLETAREQYEAGKYEAAIATIEAAREQLETTRRKARKAREAIEAAEKMHDRQRGISSVADVVDDDSLLGKAKQQYDAGNYEAARSTARAARRNAMLSIFAVNGTAGSVVLGAIVYKSERVRDALSSLRDGWGRNGG